MDDLTIETFTPLVDSAFRTTGPDGTAVVLRLVEVRSLGSQPHAPRVEPFALEFVGPAEPRLEQQIFQLEQEALAGIEIFLVPIGLEADGGFRYEAVFN
jgi:hypothetical protein